MSNWKRSPTSAGWPIFLGLIALIGLWGCTSDPDPTPVATPEPLPTEAALVVASTETPSPVPPTPIPPTPTPQLAAIVNGQPILLEVFEQELNLYAQALAANGQAVTPEDRTRVFMSLVEQEIIAQAAEANGILISPEMVQSRVNEVILEIGGQANFDAWLADNQYTLEGFSDRLLAEMQSEGVVNFVTAEVPYAVEQRRARHIEVSDLALAEQLVGRARNGEDFGTLAQQNSINTTRDIGGDLGWFARGALFVPEIEAAAFALELGQVSDPIPTVRADGTQVYHIVTVIEIDPSRPLSAEQRFDLLRVTFEQWLTTQIAQAEIVRIVE